MTICLVGMGWKLLGTDFISFVSLRWYMQSYFSFDSCNIQSSFIRIPELFDSAFSHPTFSDSLIFRLIKICLNSSRILEYVRNY